jgi:hypothetical protein
MPADDRGQESAWSPPPEHSDEANGSPAASPSPYSGPYSGASSQPQSQPQPQPYGAPPQSPPPYGAPPYGSPYGAPPTYGAPGPYGYPPGSYPRPRNTNGFAIASLVLGILWLYWVGSILALIFGYVARKQIREHGDAGGGLAIAGIVLGWIGVGVLALVIILVIVHAAAAGPPGFST